MRLPWKEEKTIIPHTLWNVRSQRSDLQARTLSHQPDYHAAKKLGDYNAAFEIVDRLISPAAMGMIESRLDLASYQTNSKRMPIVVAPVKLGGSNNVLPIASAHRIAYELGLDVDREIVQVDNSSRTGKSALYRMLHQPAFAGDVQKGGQYVIVDDVYTQGGSIAGLASYIEARGGHVACSTVLANQSNEKGALWERFKPKELQLNVDQKTLDQIDKNYGWGFAGKFEKAVGFSVEALTNREAGFVAQFSKCQREFFRAVEAEIRGDGEPASGHRSGHARHSRPARSGGSVFETQSPTAP